MAGPTQHCMVDVVYMTLVAMAYMAPGKTRHGRLRSSGVVRHHSSWHSYTCVRLEAADPRMFGHRDELIESPPPSAPLVSLQLTSHLDPTMSLSASKLDDAGTRLRMY
jgi:hypothetical protein